MPETIFSINEAQFQKLLAAQQAWWPVASVFVSAFLAMMTGIGLERLRAWFERRKLSRDQQAHEIRQINAIISGLAFDIELLFHNVSQDIMPHYRDSVTILSEIEKDEFNQQHLENVVRSLNKYPSLFTTSPDMYLVEYDFSKELPFIIERDPQTVKHSGWLVNGARELRSITATRNRYINDALALDRPQAGQKNLEDFKTVVRRQVSVASTECVVVSQLFDVLLSLVKALEKINQDYVIHAKKSKIVLPQTLEKMMTDLKEIADRTPIRS